LLFTVEPGVRDLALSLDGGVSFVRGTGPGVRREGVFARSLSGPGVYEFLSSPPATWAKPRPARPSETGGGGGGTDVGDGIIE